MGLENVIEAIFHTLKNQFLVSTDINWDCQKSSFLWDREQGGSSLWYLRRPGSSLLDCKLRILFYTDSRETVSPGWEVKGSLID